MSVWIRTWAWLAAVVALSGCSATLASSPARPGVRDGGHGGPRVLSSFAPPEGDGRHVVVCSNVGACRAVGR
jgi:hypothetical protein